MCLPPHRLTITFRTLEILTPLLTLILGYDQSTLVMRRRATVAAHT
jgi:hypothetical protein